MNGIKNKKKVLPFLGAELFLFKTISALGDNLFL